jgi:hypothetical protein
MPAETSAATSVLLATCAAFPDGEEDAAETVAALAEAGIDARWQVWDDPAADWSLPTVIRSTWDYTERREEFLRWVAGVPVLFNPPHVVRWNSDKRYLADLSGAGVPIVPTQIVPPGDGTTLPADVEYVVKPAVGAGSRGAGRFAAGDLDGGAAQLALLHEAGRTALVQPYCSAVDGDGETSLLYFDGEFSHAVRKGAMLPAGTVHALHAPHLYVEERMSPREPREPELAVGAKVIAYLRERFGEDLLYTRVDLLPAETGPVLVELELTEPSLFFNLAPGSAGRFAAAVASRLRNRTS